MLLPCSSSEISDCFHNTLSHFYECKLFILILFYLTFWKVQVLILFVIASTSQANAKRNFVETVEAHVALGVDPRRGDQV